jgi:hypothetical protein
MKRQRVSYNRPLGRGRYTFGDFLRGGERLLNRSAKSIERTGVRFLKSGGGLSQLINAAQAVKGAGLYTGRGEYANLHSGDVTHHNNLVAGGASSNSIPAFTGSGDETGAVCITHSEYMGDIYAPGTAGSTTITPFSIQSWSLNPGLEASFPFLSQIACNYAEYEFVQLIFHYRSTTTDVGSSTTGQCGTIIMATQYNASAALWQDKQEMMQAAHAMDCKVTEHMTHGVECDPAKTALSTERYVRANPVIKDEDKKTYDHGTFQVALCNCPPAYNGLPVGELWVSYKVMLRKPKLFVTRGLSIDKDSYVCRAAAPLSATMSATQWFGAAASTFARAQQNNIGCLVEPLGTAVTQPGISAGQKVVLLTFPASYTGNVKITVRIVGTVITGQFGYQFSNTSISGLNLLFNAEGTPTNEDYQLTATQLNWEGCFRIQPSTNGYNSIISFGAITATTVTQASIEIEEIQPLGGLQQQINGNYRAVYVNSATDAVVTL